MLLWPLSLVFGVVAAVRRYVLVSLLSKRLPVPVIVVGNLTVGGTGKTPLVIWLVDMLRGQGYRPGVVSRGYGAAVRSETAVCPDSLAEDVGDEPVLIARRCDCPVWVGKNRFAAGQALIRSNPEVNVIVADDGLQHYSLPRDVEIAVVDGRRGLGNGLLLPAGPLREGRSRLKRVDAVVINGEAAAGLELGPVSTMTLKGRGFYRLGCSEERLRPSDLGSEKVHAVAAIGNPARFFDTLRELGLTVVPHALPDHHRFVAGDLPAGTTIITEKDSVKCQGFGRDDLWVYAVDAEVSGGLEEMVLAKLENRDG